MLETIRRFNYHRTSEIESSKEIQPNLNEYLSKLTIFPHADLTIRIRSLLFYRLLQQGENVLNAAFAGDGMKLVGGLIIVSQWCGLIQIYIEPVPNSFPRSCHLPFRKIHRVAECVSRFLLHLHQGLKPLLFWFLFRVINNPMPLPGGGYAENRRR